MCVSQESLDQIVDCGFLEGTWRTMSETLCNLSGCGSTWHIVDSEMVVVLGIATE